MISCYQPVSKKFNENYKVERRYKEKKTLKTFVHDKSNTKNGTDIKTSLNQLIEESHCINSVERSELFNDVWLAGELNGRAVHWRSYSRLSYNHIAYGI